MSGQLPDGLGQPTCPAFGPDDKPMATRNANGEALNAIAKHIPTMIGGDADLAGSTKTLINGADNTGLIRPAERNVRFGVREHGMGAIVNGLALHGGIIKPYSATFLTFSDYMRGAIRLGALMGITRSTSSPTTASAWAKMARLTSRLSISPPCAPFPI